MLERGEYGEMFLTSHMYVFLKQYYKVLISDWNYRWVKEEFQRISNDFISSQVFKSGFVYKISDVDVWSLDTVDYNNIRICIDNLLQHDEYVVESCKLFHDKFINHNQLRVSSITFTIGESDYIINNFPIDLLSFIDISCEGLSEKQCAGILNADKRNSNNKWHYRSPYTNVNYTINILRDPELTSDVLTLIERNHCVDNHLKATDIIYFAAMGEVPNPNPFDIPIILENRRRPLMDGIMDDDYYHSMDDLVEEETPIGWINKKEKVENIKYKPVSISNKDYKGYGIIVNKPNADETYSCLVRERGKFKFIKVKSSTFKEDKGALKEFCSIKVKKADVSSQVFKNKRVKEEMVNKIYPITEYTQGYTCKQDGLKRNIIVISNEKTQTKFVEDDVEIFYPKELVAYNPPKNRNPVVGSKAIIINSKGVGLPEGEKVTVEAIYPNKTKELRGDNLVQIKTSKGSFKVKQNKIKVI